jgi:hypothetical protein
MARDAAGQRKDALSMTSSDSTTILKGGDVRTEQSRRGKKFFGWNFQRKKEVFFGTLRGSTFEKVSSIYERPNGSFNPSFCYTVSEWNVIMASGATRLRVCLKDRSFRYEISVTDFEEQSAMCRHPRYGQQIFVPCYLWTRLGKKKKAAEPRPSLAIKPAEGQTRLFP